VLHSEGAKQPVVVTPVPSCTQPLAGLQVSVVQLLLSAQLIAAPVQLPF
jgi:hypothetical protein